MRAAACSLHLEDVLHLLSKTWRWCWASWARKTVAMPPGAQPAFALVARRQGITQNLEQRQHAHSWGQRVRERSLRWETAALVRCRVQHRGSTRSLTRPVHSPSYSKARYAPLPQSTCAEIARDDRRSVGPPLKGLSGNGFGLACPRFVAPNDCFDNKSKRNRGVGDVLGDDVMASALIDHLAHHCHRVNVHGNSCRMRHHCRAATAAHRSDPGPAFPSPRKSRKEVATTWARPLRPG